MRKLYVVSVEKLGRAGWSLCLPIAVFSKIKQAKVFANRKNVSAKKARYYCSTAENLTEDSQK